MSERMKEIRAIVRRECVAELVHALEQAGVARLYAFHLHALGAGVDPERFQVSFEDGESYTEKTRVEFLCGASEVERLVNVVREHACTGHRGDGMVIVTDVDDVVNIRTGDHDGVALL